MMKQKRKPTLSWLVMESCWLVGARITEPVIGFWPKIANELCVVSHEYRLNGSPFTCSKTETFITFTPQQNKIQKAEPRQQKGETFEVGLMGWMRVHLGRTFPLATHVSQCRPESQFLSATHVCPSCSRVRDKFIEVRGKKGYRKGLKLLVCTLRASEEWTRSKMAKRVVTSVGFCEKEREENEVCVLEQRKNRGWGRRKKGGKIPAWWLFVVLIGWEKRWDIVAFIFQLQRLNAKFEFRRVQHASKTCELNVNHFIAVVSVMVQ